jgi:membrane-bound lytic murein transglycosylase A
LTAQPFADPNARTSAARAFYELHFEPLKLSARMRPVAKSPPGASEKIEGEGRFTGYFEPHYPARASRTEEFSAPLYARPDDLVMVDLGRFRAELAGQRIAGRVEDGALNPYPSHAEINAGALAGKARILAFMRPVDLLFLQIQGSGRLTTPDGGIRVGYDGANGRPYTAIGRTLIEMGALTRETVSMQTIMDWLEKAPPPDAQRVRESNESFVFFRVLDDLADDALGPLGSQGAQLTAGRSLAVDPRYAPLGAPVWVSIDGEDGQAPLRRLFIAQDAGGAIKGPVRGDIFFGSGPEAGEAAGGFNEIGEMIVFVPKTVAARRANGRSLRGGA